MKEEQDLQDCVRNSILNYFKDLGEQAPSGLHDLFLQTVEKPLLEVVMARAENNQSRAAQWLGMNRNTLRKKLLEHQLID
jgi:Fis family transcriptional regulator, factor for inversion stimulation protein